jgi:Zn-dependent membrane protease YugP
MFRASILLCVGLYLVLTVFQVVTLPVEFDASRRALRQLEGLGLLDRSEMVGARATLSAAAWTYVAALVVVLGRLLYYLSLASGNRGRR